MQAVEVSNVATQSDSMQVVEKAEVESATLAEAVVTIPAMVTAPPSGNRRNLNRRTIAKHALHFDRSSLSVAAALGNDFQFPECEQASIRDRVADMRTAVKLFVASLRAHSHIDDDDRSQMFHHMEQSLRAVEMYDSDADN